MEEDDGGVDRIRVGRARPGLPWRRLTIVAGGALEYLPFAALPFPGGAARQTTALLISSHEVVTLPSASSLALLRKAARQPAAKTIAVFADPVFASDDPRVKKPGGAPTD